MAATGGQDGQEVGYGAGEDDGRGVLPNRGLVDADEPEGETVVDVDGHGRNIRQVMSIGGDGR